MTLALALLVVALPAAAKTPDGKPPSVETICDSQSGAAYGLCTAYCEAMDCDSPAPHASASACSKVRGNYQRITGHSMPCDATCPCGDQISLFASIAAGTETIGVCYTNSSETTIYTSTGDVVTVLNGNGCQANGVDPFVPLTPEQSALCGMILRNAAATQSVTCTAPPE
jgi:hypothetical protein